MKCTCMLTCVATAVSLKAFNNMYGFTQLLLLLLLLLCRP
jgi:hypothetical protein